MRSPARGTNSIEVDELSQSKTLPSRGGHEPSAATLRVSVKAVAWLWAVSVVGLVLAHLLGQFSKYQLGRDHLLGFVSLFNLDAELNVPTWFASMSLFVSALLLALIAGLKRASRDPFSLHWIGLCVIFVGLSVDEAAGLHERLSGLISSHVATRGVFLYAWTIPAAVAVVVVGLVYLRFLFHLPRVVRYLFVVAAVAYAGGALGMEMIEGKFVTALGQDNLAHSLLVAWEELLELAGVAVFICALVLYLSKEYSRVEIRFGAKAMQDYAGATDSRSSDDRPLAQPAARGAGEPS